MNFIVLSMDGTFLNRSGDFIKEYPDAALFTGKAAAKRAIGNSNRMQAVMIVSTKDYASGKFDLG